MNGMNEFEILCGTRIPSLSYHFFSFKGLDLIPQKWTGGISLRNETFYFM